MAFGLDRSSQERDEMTERPEKSRREFPKNMAVGAVAAKVGLLAATEVGAADAQHRLGTNDPKRIKLVEV